VYILIIAVVAIIATSLPTNKPADIKVDQTKSAITKTIATPKTTVQKVKPSKQIVKEVVKPKKIIKKAPVEVKKPEPIKEVVALEPKKQELAKLETKPESPKQEITKENNPTSKESIFSGLSIFHVIGFILALAIAAYFYFRKEKKQTLKDILGREEFKQGQQGSVEESATEPQVEQSTAEEVKTEPQAEQSTTEEVKTEPQLSTEEDEKK
jgi:hypothetical protein